MKSDEPTSTTMTLRMRESTKSKLALLADHTQRSKSFLANDAIERYLDRELAIVAGVQRGLSDMQAGRVVSHEQAMARIDVVIADVSKGTHRE